jgi:hypothetical protein
VGGERGCAAASSCRCWAVIGVEDEVGSKRKNMKPMARMAARTNVIGLVRRRDRGRAMMAWPGLVPVLTMFSSNRIQIKSAFFFFSE